MCNCKLKYLAGSKIYTEVVSVYICNTMFIYMLSTLYLCSGLILSVFPLKLYMRLLKNLINVVSLMICFPRGLSDVYWKYLFRLFYVYLLIRMLRMYRISDTSDQTPTRPNVKNGILQHMRSDYPYEPAYL